MSAISNVLSGTKKRYQSDISFLCPPVINLIKAHVRTKNERDRTCAVSGVVLFWRAGRLRERQTFVVDIRALNNILRYLSNI